MTVITAHATLYSVTQTELKFCKLFLLRPEWAAVLSEPGTPLRWQHPRTDLLEKCLHHRRLVLGKQPAAPCPAPQAKICSPPWQHPPQWRSYNAATVNKPERPKQGALVLSSCIATPGTGWQKGGTEGNTPYQRNYVVRGEPQRLLYKPQ